MINCQYLKFSDKLSQQRINQFKTILGEKIINKVICFALFLLGVDRKSISELINIPPGSIRSIIKSIRINGIVGFEDHRKKSTSFLSPSPENIKSEISVFKDDENLIVNLGLPAQRLQIPLKNPLQMKNFLLTLLHNGLIPIKQIVTVLNLTTTHIINLTKKLQEQDFHGLIDKRQGQKEDYKVTSAIKAELIQQFAANVISGKSVSSHVLLESINQRCKLDLSTRSVRLHVQNMGLHKIKKSLPELIDTLKKTPINGLK